MAIYNSPQRWLSYDTDGTLLVDSNGNNIGGTAMSYMNDNDRNHFYTLTNGTRIYFYLPVSVAQASICIWTNANTSTGNKRAYSIDSTSPLNGNWTEYSGGFGGTGAPTTDDWYRTPTMLFSGTTYTGPTQAMSIANFSGADFNIYALKIAYNFLQDTPTYITNSGVTNNYIQFYRDDIAGDAATSSFGYQVFTGQNSLSEFPQNIGLDFGDTMRNTTQNVNGINSAYGWGTEYISNVPKTPYMLWAVAYDRNNKTANNVLITPTNNGGSDSLATNITLSLDGAAYAPTVTIPTMAPGFKQKIYVRMSLPPDKSLGTNSCRLISTVASWT